MGIPLDTGGATIPSIKLRNIGDYVDVAIAAIKVVPRRVFNSDEIKVRPDGTPQTQDHLTVVVVGGNGVVVENDHDRTVTPGEVAGIFIAGRDRWDKDGDAGRAKGEPKSWSGAKADHGRLNVGDVVRWRFDAEVPGKGDRDRKIRTFKLRPPRPEEADQTARCERIYHDGTGVELEPAAAAFEEPF